MKEITFIGSGNLATHLAKALFQEGFVINQILSRTKKSAKILSDQLNTTYTYSTELKDIKKTDLIIISVNDDLIRDIACKLPNFPIVHTSGSTSIDVFKNKFDAYGVLYPLQTFNKKIKINVSEVPFCVEANNKEFEDLLVSLSKNLSKSVHIIDSRKRKQLHISAIFACNFTNHMYSVAEKILHDEDIDFSILLPIIKQSINKIESGNIEGLQTGPAKRKDLKIIKDHLRELKNLRYNRLYKIISDEIMKNE